MRTAGSAKFRRQGGAAAMEFALVFPMLFILTYGAIIYSYAYILRQSLTFAAQEGAEAAVDVDPNPDKNSNYDGAVKSAVTFTTDAVLSWMPSRVRSNIVQSVSFCSAGQVGGACPADGSDAVVVTLTLSFTGASQLFAKFPFPGFGNFPPLPDTMIAQAVARV